MRRDKVHGFADWLFRDRHTGRRVIGQRPNRPLLVWIGASTLRRVLDPADGTRTALEVTQAVAITWWAGDEILRGANPWRRLLGGGILLMTAASWSKGGRASIPLSRRQRAPAADGAVRHNSRSGRCPGTRR